MEKYRDQVLDQQLDREIQAADKLLRALDERFVRLIDERVRLLLDEKLSGKSKE